MAEIKKYLDHAGLVNYDTKIKLWIQNNIHEVEEYIGTLPTDATSTDIVSYVAEYVNGKIGTLESTYATVAAAIAGEKALREDSDKDLDERITALEEATTVADAIDELDATVTNAVAEGDQPDVVVTVVEEDGVLTSVSAVVTAERFDAFGAAAAVQGETEETVASVDAKVEALGTAAEKDALVGEIASAATEGDDDASADLVSVAQVKKFVADEVADLEGAMHFIDTFEALPETKADGSAFEAGDVIIVGTKEYVFNGSEFKELGDEGTHVTKSTTIAGIDLENDITADEMKVALDIDDLETAVGVPTVEGQAGTGLTKRIEDIEDELVNADVYVAITEDEIAALFEEEDVSETTF